MNLAEFRQIKAELAVKLAAAISKSLRDLGDDIEYVDWVSYRPHREIEQLAKSAKAA